MASGPLRRWRRAAAPVAAARTAELRFRVGRWPTRIPPAQPPAPVAGGEELRDLAQLLAAVARIGKVEGLALGAESADHQRHRPHELLDPVLAMAEADAGVLPAAH